MIKQAKHQCRWIQLTRSFTFIHESVNNVWFIGMSSIDGDNDKNTVGADLFKNYETPGGLKSKILT